MSTASTEVTSELLNRDGAHRLRSRLERYWHDRGFDHVEVTVVAMNYKRFALYAVRSNLVNGLPPIRVSKHPNPAMKRNFDHAERSRLRPYAVGVPEAVLREAA